MQNENTITQGVLKMGPRKGSQSLSVLLELPTVVLTQGEKTVPIVDDSVQVAHLQMDEKGVYAEVQLDVNCQSPSRARRVSTLEGSDGGVLGHEQGKESV